jgi:Protein of unknown function (DUF3800)
MDNENIVDNISENVKKDISKEEKIELERKELLNRVLSGNIPNLKERVAFILNTSIPSRNSDVELIWLYWQYFESSIFNGETINKNQLKELTRFNSITRERARIQNQYRLFQADDEVKKARGVLEEEKKQEALEQRPNWPFYEVFIDETGKTQEYISVGSLWIVDEKAKVFAYGKLKDWKRLSNIDFEFHFSEVKGHKIDHYKAFFLKFLSLNPTAGFKVIIINKKGLSNISEAITDLTFHLINKGIKHENESGRAPLPRLLQIRLDQEETGLDNLRLENLVERISSQQIEGLKVDSFEALDSKDNFFIQAIDLFTASVNRKLHNPSGAHFKDELADYILGLLNFDIGCTNG